MGEPHQQWRQEDGECGACESKETRQAGEGAGRTVVLPTKAKESPFEKGAVRENHRYNRVEAFGCGGGR